MTDPSRGLVGVAGTNYGTLLYKAFTPSAAPSYMPTFVYTYQWTPAPVSAAGGGGAAVLVSATWGGSRFNPVMVGYRPSTATGAAAGATMGAIYASQSSGYTWTARSESVV